MRTFLILLLFVSGCDCVSKQENPTETVTPVPTLSIITQELLSLIPSSKLKSVYAGYQIADEFYIPTRYYESGEYELTPYEWRTVKDTIILEMLRREKAKVKNEKR